MIEMLRQIALGLVLTACRGSSESPQPLSLDGPVAAITVPGKRVTLAARTRHIGEVTVMRRDVTIHGLVERDGVSRGWLTHEHLVRRFEVLAVAENLVTKARMSFPEESYRGDIETAKPLLQGHTYLGEWHDGGLTIEREDHQQMTDAEAAQIQSRASSEIGSSDGIDEAITGRTLESGQVIALPAERIAKSIAAGVTLGRAEARLIDVRERVAVIEVHLVGKVGAQAFESRDLSTWSVDSSQPTRVDSVALFRGTLDGAATSNRVEGTMEYRDDN